MRLVIISDTHCQHKKLILPNGEILIHAGDWTHQGEENNTIDFLKWLNKQKKYEYSIFIAGNHDFLPEKNPEFFKELLKLYAPNVIYLEDKTITLNGFKIHGSPVSPMFNEWAFNRNEEQIQHHWNLIPDDVEILITHVPPYGYGDKLSKFGSIPGSHAGCPYLLKTIDKRLHKLKYHIVGHIHEGYGMYQHKNITIVNASILDELYRMRNKPVEIEI